MAQEDAFETEELLLNDLVAISAGSVDPTTTGYAAPIGSLYLRDTGQQYQKTGGADTAWGELAAGGGDEPHMEQTFNQATHGLLLGEVVRYAAGAWVLAQADTAGNSEALGVISDVPDANNFTVTYSGRITGLSGLTPDSVYFLSAATAGAVVLTEPAPPLISKPIFFATSATEAVIQIRRGVNADVGGGGSDIAVEDEGIELTTAVTRFNFVGGGVTVTEPVADEVQVNIPGGENPAICIRRSTGFTVTTSVLPIAFDLTEVENDPTVLEHNNTNTERVDIKETGLYAVGYAANINAPPSDGTNAEIRCVLRLNGVTNLDHTHSDTTVFNDASIPGGVHEDSISLGFTICQLSAGDYVELTFIKTDLGAASTVTTESGEVVLSLMKLDGSAGPTGPQGLPGSGSSVTVEDDNVAVPNTPHTTLNFTGAGVTVTDAGSGQADIDIPGGGGGGAFPAYFLAADQFENPNNADWPINALAPAIVDPSNNAITVRAFDDATEEGVGWSMYVPASAVNMQIDILHRAETAGGGSTGPDYTLRSREIVDGGAVPAWSTFEGTAWNIANDTNFHKETIVDTLANWNLSADAVYQIEFTRKAADVSDDLVGDLFIQSIRVSFT